MTFRARLFAALLAAVALPLVLLALGVRREMTRRLAADDDRRVASLLAVLRDDLATRSGAAGRRLAALRERMAGDNELRATIAAPGVSASGGSPVERRYLLDWAGDAMRLTGLAMLRVQDSAGTILSSGHFRNEYDRVEPALPRLLAARHDSVVLVRARTADAPVLALARVDSVRIGGRAFSLVGGLPLDSAGLARLGAEGDLAVRLVLPDADSAALRTGRTVADLPIPFVDLTAGAAQVDPPASPSVSAPDRAGIDAAVAHLAVIQAPGALAALGRSVDAWALVALALSGAVAVLAAAWLAARVSRPLRQLADQTSTLDLDRLDAEFASDRPDEIGDLSRLLGEMTARLRQSTARLREVERRAAMGDVARQVNHDVKNGLTPIRHVLRHLAQVARDEPASLARVFEERKATLEASVAYLETLARNYARLSPRLDREPCDLNAVVRQVVRDASARPEGARVDAARAVELRTVLADDLPRVAADEVVLRRIAENLVTNAIESLDGQSANEGTGPCVTVSTAIATGDRAPAPIRLVVADTGRGMTRAELEHAFDDFYTTKPDGTGLGLSIVRRLVQDLGGTLRIETEPGAGSRVTVELPPGRPLGA
ncbi:MAG TPA: HAMP domain-containing sensor histidine kinase [Gemmatimonadales bacterium]|nr:HAMP domain-containing sensor histidine kinase [Gemmatimonadales bacterium]